jgi:hypothetical protein
VGYTETAGSRAAETAEIPEANANKMATICRDLLSFGMSNISVPLVFRHEFVRSENRSPAASRLDLMSVVYLTFKFAKMTGLPDKLTETPERTAPRLSWTS